jgi:hypothetical protein
MTSFPLHGLRLIDRDPDDPGPLTLMPRMPFRDQLIDKLADLLVAAAEVIDLIGESTNSRCARTGRPESEAEEALRCTTTGQVARSVESIYDEVNRLMLGMTD